MAQIMNEAGEPIVTSEKHGYVTVVTLNRCVSCPAFFFLRCSAGSLRRSVSSHADPLTADLHARPVSLLTASARTGPSA